jgi:ElaB/YqjD/DUF883 family membrane-anchored ribosome-binding protein
MNTEELFSDEEHEFSEFGRPDVEEMKRELEDRARHALAWTRERVFEHPFAALGIAVAAGFVFGRLVTR